MIFAVVWYTVLCVALNSVATGGGSNLMTPEDEANLTDATRAERVRGSKWVFVSEHAFLLCIWSLKACMLVIYSRITYVIPHDLIVLMIFVVLTWYLSERASASKNGSIGLPSMLGSASSLPSCHFSSSAARSLNTGLCPRTTVSA
jgi:hypothetical protein